MYRLLMRDYRNCTIMCSHSVPWLGEGLSMLLPYMPSLRCPVPEVYFFFLWLVRHSILATCLWLEYCQACFSELSLSRISESTTGYTFTPCVIYFNTPGIHTSMKEPLAFGVSSERHRQCEMNEIAKRRQVELSTCD